MKVLAENGFCTIRNIVDNDGFSRSKKLRKKRHDEYDRIIKGEPDNFPGLIAKRLVQPENHDWENTKNNRYRLAIFGVFYAIHLFSDPNPKCHIHRKHQEKLGYWQTTKISFNKLEQVKKYKIAILDILVYNYSDLLPLIFKKWDLLTTEFGSMVDVLIDFAHVGGPTSSEIDREPLFNTRPLTLRDWKSKNGIYSDEITMWFYGYQCSRLYPRQFNKIMSKDKDIFNWYSKYLTLLSKTGKEELLRIQFAKYVLKGELKKAKEKWKEINSLQGINQLHQEFVFN